MDVDGDCAGLSGVRSVCAAGILVGPAAASIARAESAIGVNCGAGEISAFSLCCDAGDLCECRFYWEKTAYRVEVSATTIGKML